MHVFIHIPKTAGTSFKAALKKRFPNHFLYGDIRPAKPFAEEKPKLGKYDLVTGHLTVADFDSVEGEKQFLTIVRNPIDRLLSLFHYIRQRKHHSLYPFSLCGPEMFFRACRDISDHGYHQRAVAVNAREVTDGMCLRLSGSRSSERALEQIKKMGIVVLRQESLERDVRERLGWSDFDLPELNTGSKKSDYPPTLKALIAQMNKEDLALFEAVS